MFGRVIWKPSAACTGIRSTPTSASLGRRIPDAPDVTQSLFLPGCADPPLRCSMFVLPDAGQSVTVASDGSNGFIGPFARVRARVYHYALERRAGRA
jgi:hypothetical protein